MVTIKKVTLKYTEQEMKRDSKQHTREKSDQMQQKTMLKKQEIHKTYKNQIAKWQK